jgi:hypothetical protein
MRDTARLAVAFALPSYILVIIQFVGISITDQFYRPLYHLGGLGELIGWAGFFLSILSPFSSVVALRLARKSKLSLVKTSALTFLCGLAVAFGLLGCGWTFSGHPTWGQGYGG